MRYHRLGEVPAKRHVQFRRDARLLVEEVMGYEGFSGNESILYHLVSPCRVAEVLEFTPIAREEWVPDAHVHRLTQTGPLEPEGDPVHGRRLLMWNGDVEISVCKPAQGSDVFFRDGEGDEVLFVKEGSGVLETVFGTLPFRRHDYVVIPRGTTHRFRLDDGPQTWLCFQTPGEIETPNRYRNRYGQLLEHAPFSQRDFHPPAAATSASSWTTTRSTSSAGTATSTRTRSTSPTSSPRPAVCTSRRRRTRRSRARTSSSARSARACSTGTRTRSRCRTTTPTCSRRR